jgi:hypothetical protein
MFCNGDEVDFRDSVEVLINAATRAEPLAFRALDYVRSYWRLMTKVGVPYCHEFSNRRPLVSKSLSTARFFFDSILFLVSFVIISHSIFTLLPRTKCTFGGTLRLLRGDGVIIQ